MGDLRTQGSDLKVSTQDGKDACLLGSQNVANVFPTSAPEVSSHRLILGVVAIQSFGVQRTGSLGRPCRVVAAGFRQVRRLPRRMGAQNGEVPGPSGTLLSEIATSLGRWPEAARDGRGRAWPSSAIATHYSTIEYGSTDADPSPARSLAKPWLASPCPTT